MSKPKTLVFDIETSLMKVYCFRLGEQYIGHEQIIEDWQVLSFAAKWAGEKKVYYDDKRSDKTDKRIIKGIWGLLDEADLVITQNGKQFDAKKLNTRFLCHGLNPPAPYKHIDTLQIARKKFGFTSNKLAYTSALLCPEEQKSSHREFPGLELWKECENGNLRAWEEMKKYNIQDVLATEAYYKRIAAWDGAVNRSQDGGCRVCGSTRLTRRGSAISEAGRYPRYQCQDCGAWMRGAVNEMSTEEKRKAKRNA